MTKPARWLFWIFFSMEILPIMAADMATIPWDLPSLFQPPKMQPADGFASPGLQAIYYDGLPFQGKATRVFAWYGKPDLPQGQKAPAMVLVHGGLGTAEAKWVKLWISRGYAAIAMDLCGCVPRAAEKGWERHEAGGPPGWGGFEQGAWPMEDQWPYHAVADIILAHSLFRSFPEIDPNHIGLTGISWGGYLASIVAGVDPRFRFAAPVYGCGDIQKTAFCGAVQGMGDELGSLWLKRWDPIHYLPNATFPMLWVSGSNDFAYHLPAWQASYRLGRGPRTLCLRLRMPHSQDDGSAPDEIRAFADSFCKQALPLPVITDQGCDGMRPWVSFQSSTAITQARLNFTCDTAYWPDRKWEELPAEIDKAQNKVWAALPEKARVYYFNLIDEHGCLVSSEHVDLK